MSGLESGELESGGQEAGGRDVAVFVDAENAHWLCDEAIPALIQRVAEYGRVRHRRAYADWRQVASNKVLTRYTRFGFELVQVYLPVAKKNSADVALAVDVMDHLWRFPAIGCVVLVTGDSDFTPVFRRVRERSVECVGCGPRSVLSEVVMHHCTQFIFAESLGGRPQAPVPADDERKRAVRFLLAQVVAGLEGEVSPSVLKSRMLEAMPDLDERALGFGSFTAFLRVFPDVISLVQNRHGTWLARPLASAVELRTEPEVVPAVVDPIEAWRTRLRKMSWPFVDRDRVLGVAAAAEAVEEGLSRGALKARLAEERPDLGTPAEIGRALEVLFKAQLMDRVGDGFAFRLDLTEAEIEDAVDRAMLSRLRSAAQREGLELPEAVVKELLLGPADADRVSSLWEDRSSGEE